MATTSEPRLSTLSRTLASNRARSDARSDSFTMTATRIGAERRDPDERPWPPPAIRTPGLDDRARDHVRRDLDARDDIAGRHDRAVEPGEDLERIDPVEPLELGGPDVEDPVVRRQQVDPALDGPAPAQTRARDGIRQPERRVVLVQIAGLEDDDRDRADPERRVRRPCRRGRRPRAAGPSPSGCRRPRGRAPGPPPREPRAGGGPASDARAAPAVDPWSEPGRGRSAAAGQAPPRSRASCRRRPSPPGTRCRHGCRR